MAFDRSYLNQSGEFNILQKGVLIKSFEQVAKQAATQGATDTTSAATVGAALDALITKLKAAGIMA